MRERRNLPSGEVALVGEVHRVDTRRVLLGNYASAQQLLHQGHAALDGNGDGIAYKSLKHCLSGPCPVTARKDDVPAADQAATTNLARLMPISGGGGLIQTTSG